eukprot:CAMPEP_0197595778 /NCGR_PEP_ID=MMETSP1326-20131121/23680_1 /TAXON_ID=1155430 /ORGANISM="Genus nov. species nov., Strain RCC2288" /LENGTH=67 /DNA_ID=CAMNT_0043162181 /DNA_START=130 /DNA_END=329 /DNA_ORIENTATION=+
MDRSGAPGGAAARSYQSGADVLFDEDAPTTERQQQHRDLAPLLNSAATAAAAAAAPAGGAGSRTRAR